MTASARELLTAFDALDPTEKQQVAVEILRRSAGVDNLTDETFDELRAELFRDYEAEEAKADSLVDDLLQSSPAFQALVAKSKASPRKPFTPGSGA